MKYNSIWNREMLLSKMFYESKSGKRGHWRYKYSSEGMERQTKYKKTNQIQKNTWKRQTKAIDLTPWKRAWRGKNPNEWWTSSFAFSPPIASHTLCLVFSSFKLFSAASHTREELRAFQEEPGWVQSEIWSCKIRLRLTVSISYTGVIQSNSGPRLMANLNIKLWRDSVSVSTTNSIEPYFS